MNLREKTKVSKRTLSAFMLGVLLAGALLGGALTLMANPGGSATYITGGSFTSDYSYLVYTNGTHYFMQNGTTGTVDVESTSAVNVINWALGNLTSGRTSQETVRLKGDFGTISSPIAPDSYTILEGPAKIKLADSSNCHVIQVYSKQYVSIRGLSIEANEDGQSTGMYCGIYVEDSSNVEVKDCNIYNATRYGLTFNRYGDDGHDTADNSRNCSDCQAINNFIFGSRWNNLVAGYSEHVLFHRNTVTFASDYGISTWQSNDVVISNNISFNNTKEEGYDNNHWNIGVEHNSRVVSVENNIVYGSKVGVGTHDDSSLVVFIGNVIGGNRSGHGVWISDAKHVTAAFNIIEVGAKEGIQVDGPPNTAYNTTLIGNKMRGGDLNGMLIQGDKGIISDNTVYNASGYNIYVTGDDWDIRGNFVEQGTAGISVGGDRNTITNNRILDSQRSDGRGIMVTGNNCTVYDNYCEGNKVGLFLSTGNGTIIKGNYLKSTSLNVQIISGTHIWEHGNILGGKPCENSGTATNTTATTFVFDHGLASTATGVWASFNTTAVTGYTWTPTATQITITVTGTLPASMTTYWTAEYKP